MEHFEELLNRPAPQDPPDVPPASDDLPIACDPPTKKEIYQAIKQLKNGKSTGSDSFPAEASKTDKEPVQSYCTPSSRRSGRKNKSHQNGRKATSSSRQRRVTSAPVPIVEE